jgi:transcriptional regulator with XRE-family HTH domain
MADKLRVTSSYLSAVEIGKRNIPSDWHEKISDFYALNAVAKSALLNAIQESQLTIKFELNKMDRSDRDLVMAFARELKDLGDDDRLKLQNIFNKNK